MFVKLFRPECTCKRIYQFSNWQNTLLPWLENYSRFKRIIRDVLSSKSFFEVVQLLSQHNWSSLSSKSGENCVNRVALARIFQFGKNKQRKYFSFRTFMDTTKKDTIGKKKNVSDFSYASLQVRSKKVWPFVEKQPCLPHVLRRMEILRSREIRGFILRFTCKLLFTPGLAPSSSFPRSLFLISFYLHFIKS